MKEIIAVFKQAAPQKVHLEIRDLDVKTVKCKNVFLKNFIRILTNAAYDETAGVVLGRMPYGYYNACVNDIGFSVIVSVPAKVAPFQYFDSVYLIPFPRLVFYFTYENGAMRQTCCFAAKDDVLSKDTELFHYPFSNVHGDGEICFGRNQVPKCKTLSDVDDVVRMFYTAPSNNDLWQTGYCKDKYPALRVFLDSLNGKETFPIELLKPFNLDVKTLEKRFISSNFKEV